MARLTPLSKALIVIALLAGLYFIYTQFFAGDGGGSTEGDGDSSWVKPSTRGGDSDDETIDIGVVTWGGYAGGQYFNEGFEANTNSRFYKDYGFKVNFEVLDDFDASRDAFKSGEVDLLWATIDAFPTEAKGLAEYQPQVVFQADWSRGGDAIVARRGINSVADLRGRKIAVAPMTPSHSFLIWLLDAGDMSSRDVELVEVPSAIDAADAFKSGTVDAAVVWSPDDADIVAKIAGSRVLESTKNATQIIADVFIAKKEYVENNKAKLQQLYEGWMKGAAEINANESNKRKAAKILAEGLAQPEDFTYDAINNVRLTTHGDNQNFFGLNTDYKGVTGEELYNKMRVKYDELGYGTADATSWRLISTSDLVRRTSLDGPANAAEGQKQFSAAGAEVRDAEALSTKKVSINFRTGEYQLDANAKQIIDLQLVPIAKAFGNARIRIEGNTDNVGNRASNVALSERRAQSVAQYLQSEHGMPRNRFVVLGNGPDNPVDGCAGNQTESCRAQNRRTDFELIAE